MALSAAWAGSLFICSEVAAGLRLNVAFFQWIELGNVRADFGLLIDPISAGLSLLATSVGLAAQLFRGGAADGRRGLLLGTMLLLTQILLAAPNYPQFIFAFSGLGLCAYWAAAGGGGRLVLTVCLLSSALLAGAAFLLQAHCGRLDFAGLNGPLPAAAPGLLVGLLLVGGALGAAAQIPLHFWLVAVARGPLPVVVLVQAIAVVPAGAVLLLRAEGLLAAMPQLATGVAVVGLVSGLLAALAALLSREASAILAHSTTSQIGLVLVGIGLGAGVQAQEHLVSHGFTKTALLLVVARLQTVEGGGRMPLTFWLGFIAVWGLAGLPPTMGFWSQSSLLVAVYNSGNWWLWAGGCSTVLLTGMYAFRLFLSEFKRTLVGQEGLQAAGEWVAYRAVPMIAMAGGIAVVGAVAPMLHLLGVEAWLSPLQGAGEGWPGTAVAAQYAALLGGGLAAIGGGLAWLLTGGAVVKGGSLTGAAAFVGSGYKGAEGAELIVGRPLVRAAQGLWDLVETLALELGLSRGAGMFLRGVSWGLDRCLRKEIWPWLVAAVLGCILVVQAVLKGAG